LTLWRDGVCQTRELACLPGDYPAYYAAVRDAIRGKGANPVSAADAIDVIRLIELGLQSAEHGRMVVNQDERRR
jgi:predicted dehydrogenase